LLAQKLPLPPLEKKPWIVVCSVCVYGEMVILFQPQLAVGNGLKRILSLRGILAKETVMMHG
jgi:hypothetical protein